MKTDVTRRASIAHGSALCLVAILLLAAQDAEASAPLAFDRIERYEYVDGEGFAAASGEAGNGVLRVSSHVEGSELIDAMRLRDEMLGEAEYRKAVATTTGVITIRDGVLPGHTYKVTLALNVPTQGADAPSVDADDGSLAFVNTDPAHHDSNSFIDAFLRIDSGQSRVSMRKALACAAPDAGHMTCSNDGVVEFTYDGVKIAGTAPDPHIELRVSLTSYSAISSFGRSASASAGAYLLRISIVQTS